MPIQAFKHPKVKRTYFIPRKNPVEAVDENRDYTKAQSATLLGVDRATVDKLIEDGRLDADEDGKIRGDSLADLAAELEPVELDLVEVGTTDEDEEKPAAPKTKATKRVKVADEARTNPTWSAECPSCGEHFDVAGEIERFKCPGCGERLTVSTESEDEKPTALNPRRRRFLGVL